MIAAVSRGDQAAVKDLIAHGVDVNATESDGTTALISLPQAGPNAAAIESLLLDAGANVDRVDGRGMNAFLVAVVSGREDLAVPLLSKGRYLTSAGRRTSLGLAVETRCSPTLVRQMIAAGSDVNAPDASRTRETPLMYAAANGDVALIDVLVAAGAIVDIRDYRGQTALFRAIGLDQPQAIACLSGHGAGLDLKDADGGTPLIAAITGFGREASLQALLKAGADPNVLVDGMSPIDIARRHQSQAKVALIETALSGRYKPQTQPVQ